MINFSNTTEQPILYKTKYILCTEAEYESIGYMIRQLSGYPDSTGTERYAPEIPIRNINNNCVLAITGDLQETRAELFTGYEMKENYEPQPTANSQ